MLITVSVQGQVGQGFEQLDLVKDVLVPSGVFDKMIFKHAFQPEPFCDSMSYN